MFCFPFLVLLLVSAFEREMTTWAGRSRLHLSVGKGGPTLGTPVAVPHEYGRATL